MLNEYIATNMKDQDKQQKIRIPLYNFFPSSFDFLILKSYSKDENFATLLSFDDK